MLNTISGPDDICVNFKVEGSNVVIKTDKQENNTLVLPVAALDDFIEKLLILQTKVHEVLNKGVIN